jgi:CheY-like chemotaxis protein
VIDDEESVRSVLSRILTQANHQVTVADNGEEGIQLFKEREFDAVLTDLGMPGMSGWEVCRIIKQITRTSCRDDYRVGNGSQSGKQRRGRARFCHF